MSRRKRTTHEQFEALAERERLPNVLDRAELREIAEEIASTAEELQTAAVEFAQSAESLEDTDDLDRETRAEMRDELRDAAGTIAAKLSDLSAYSTYAPDELPWRTVESEET